MEKELIEYLANSRNKEQQYSNEYLEQNDKCSNLCDEMLLTLNDEQKKSLRSLDMENFKLEGIYGHDIFIEGAEKGFKKAMRLVIDSMRD